MKGGSQAMAGLALCLAPACDLGRPAPMAEAVSTATFRYNGQEVTQRNSVRCQYVNLNDGVVHIGRAPWIEGDRHWLKRADGSIVIFPGFQKCMDDATVGDRRNVMTANGRFAPLSDTTYVFDNSEKPTRVDLLTAEAFASAEGDLSLSSVTLARIDSPHRLNLPAAFPGLEKLADAEKSVTAGLGDDIFPGMFLGVQASATILASNTKCGTDATSGLVILPEQDACRFVNDCEKSAPTLVCGKRQGGLRVSYDASFSRAAVLVGPPDKLYRMTLYNSQLPNFSKAPGIPWNDGRKWTPEVCIGTVCTTPGRPFLPVLFYYPAEHLLIEVGPIQQRFGAGMFSQRRML